MTSLYSFFHRFHFVKQIPVFGKLNWLELQRITRKAQIHEYKKGEIIFRQGDPADNFYCLVSGRLQVYRTNNQGEKDNVDFIHRGMHFGIISTLTGEDHSLTIEAINDSVVIQIPRADFHEILKAIPQLGLEFSESLSKRIRRKVIGAKAVFESTIVSVYSPVKGTGSSTYAINLAINLQRETGQKVVFVNIQSSKDLKTLSADGQSGTAPKWRIPAVDISELVEDHAKVETSVIREDLKVDLLNVVFNADEPQAKKQISPFVSTLVGDYHYVVVDLPNDMDDVVLETLTQSDRVHLITSDNKKDLNLIRRVIDRLETSLKENFREEKIRVVIRSKHPKIYLSFEAIDRFIDYSVYASLPVIKEDELSPDTKSQYLSFLRCHDKSEYARVIKRIARAIGGVRVGIVLGGGAALGVAHIGVIRVLEQENIPIDMIVGSSMGALVAGMWAIGNDSKGLEEIARDFERKANMIKLFDPPLFPISGLVRGRAIRRWLKKYLGTRTFYSTQIPLKIVSYDLIRREELIRNTGSLVDAVRESIAIPGVIKPVQINEQLIIDGGVLNPLPTNVLSSLGIKKIIAVNVLQSPDHVSDGYDMAQERSRKELSTPIWKNPFQYISTRIMRTLMKPFNPNISDIIVKTLQASEYVIAEQSAQQADVLIHPDLTGIDWFELYKVDELIKRGEKAARALLPQIKELIED